MHLVLAAKTDKKDKSELQPLKRKHQFLVPCFTYQKMIPSSFPLRFPKT